MAYLSQVEYPKRAKDRGIEGKVYSLCGGKGWKSDSNRKDQRRWYTCSLGNKAYSKFKWLVDSGQNNGEIVRTRFVAPFTFQLPKNENSRWNTYYFSVCLFFLLDILRLHLATLKAWFKGLFKTMYRRRFWKTEMNQTLHSQSMLFAGWRICWGTRLGYYWVYDWVKSLSSILAWKMTSNMRSTKGSLMI